MVFLADLQQNRSFPLPKFDIENLHEFGMTDRKRLPCNLMGQVAVLDRIIHAAVHGESRRFPVFRYCLKIIPARTGNFGAEFRQRAH